jgi:competence protein ComGC
VLSLFAKLDTKVLGLAATLNLKILIIILIVIFIIQIIIFLILILILNLSYSSLSESGCNTVPKSLGCESDYKTVSWKCNN